MGCTKSKEVDGMTKQLQNEQRAKAAYAEEEKRQSEIAANSLQVVVKDMFSGNEFELTVDVRKTGSWLKRIVAPKVHERSM